MSDERYDRLEALALEVGVDARTPDWDFVPYDPTDPKHPGYVDLMADLLDF